MHEVVTGAMAGGTREKSENAGGTQASFKR